MSEPKKSQDTDQQGAVEFSLELNETSLDARLSIASTLDDEKIELMVKRMHKCKTGDADSPGN